MKILLISYHFGPSNTIAAVRTTKIAKYLHRAGHDVEVICGPVQSIDPILEKDIKEIEKIHRIGRSSLTRSASVIVQRHNSGKSLNSKLFNILKKFIKILMRNKISTYLDLYNSFAWHQKTKPIIKKCVEDANVVIASFGPLGSSLGGLYAKRLKPSIKLVNDQRDSMIPETIYGIIRKIHYHYLIKLLKISDFTFCVSQGLKNSYLEICRKHNIANIEKIHVITNGYDREDIQDIDPNEITESIRESSHKLILSYCGSLYGGKRDLSALFKMIKELHESGNIDLSNVEIQYAGNDLDILLKQAAKFNLVNILSNFGMVSRKESIRISKNSDISIVATWNTKIEQGVLTGKIFELLSLNKYIFAFVSGNCGNSEIKDLIKSYNSGITYEEHDRESYFLMKDIFLKYYNTKISNRIYMTLCNKSIIEQYDYENISNTLFSIIIS